MCKILMNVFYFVLNILNLSFEIANLECVYSSNTTIFIGRI